MIYAMQHKAPAKKSGKRSIASATTPTATDAPDVRHSIAPVLATVVEAFSGGSVGFQNFLHDFDAAVQSDTAVQHRKKK